MRRFLRVLQAIYTLIVGYLLGWTLLFALIAAALQLATVALTRALGFDSTAMFWRWTATHLPGSAITLRLGLYGTIQLALIWWLRRPLARLKAWLERRIDTLVVRYRRWARRRPRGSRVVGSGLALTFTALLVPFVVQPTLVPLRWSTRHWLRRAANLADGQASWAVAESVIGLYRRFTAAPVIAPGIDADQLASRPPDPRAANPTMARWDPVIWQTVAGNPQDFALVKAVLWVESAGRQYAVSHTGCAGLMQFCSSTARSRDFRDLFGIGRVYPCRCDGPCAVPKSIQLDLESGDLQRIRAHEKRFVCALNDARFDPSKSIAAGWRYLHHLRERVGGNLYLTYLGYNSGPKIAYDLFAKLKRNGQATLPQIGQHLTTTLRPIYGKTAAPRARGLIRVHLPKLGRAYRAYRVQARTRELARGAPTDLQRAADCFSGRLTASAGG
jgi:soluble lytic murein transglycosylase-like protein